jgi:hypothetical protein
MTFFNKIKWVLGILVVFVLIVSTNLIDRNNFNRVKDSVETIYEDRLVAKDLIFEISKLIHEKELALALSDQSYFDTKGNDANTEIKTFVGQFEQTRLTSEERKVLKNLSSNINILAFEEASFTKKESKAQEPLFKILRSIKANLEVLSKIQLNEGKKQMSLSRKAIDMVELFTQIEIYFLIFLAIAIQIVVMYKPKKEL